MIFRVTESREGAKALANIIGRCANEVQQSIGNINKRELMLQHSASMKTMEEEGDVLYAQSVGALFEVDLPPLEVIKWMEIFEKLEEAIDECEDVSNVLESIALKNS